MKLKIDNKIVNAEITTDHSASSYGIPVLVIGKQAYGTADIQVVLVDASPEEKKALKKAGYI